MQPLSEDIVGDPFFQNHRHNKLSLNPDADDIYV